MVPIYHLLIGLNQTAASDEDLVKNALANHESRRRYARYRPTDMVAIETMASVEGSGTSELVGLPPLRIVPVGKDAGSGSGASADDRESYAVQIIAELPGLARTRTTRRSRRNVPLTPPAAVKN